MRKQVQIHTMQWEHLNVPDSEARLKGAYDLIFSYPQSDLTENGEVDTMPSVRPN